MRLSFCLERAHSSTITCGEMSFHFLRLSVEYWRPGIKSGFKIGNSSREPETRVRRFDVEQRNDRAISLARHPHHLETQPAPTRGGLCRIRNAPAGASGPSPPAHVTRAASGTRARPTSTPRSNIIADTLTISGSGNLSINYDGRNNADGNRVYLVQ